MTQELCRRVVSTQHPLAACSSCRPRPPRHSRGRLRGGTRGRTRVRIWRKALRDVEVSGTELLLRDTLPCRGFEYVEALFRSAHGPTSRMPRPSTRGKDPVGFAFRFTRNSPPSSTPSPPSPSPLVYSPAVWRSVPLKDRLSGTRQAKVLGRALAGAAAQPIWATLFWSDGSERGPDSYRRCLVSG